MKKRTFIRQRGQLSGTNRRRLMLKRNHQRVMTRRQQFQFQDLFDEALAEAS